MTLNFTWRFFLQIITKILLLLSRVWTLFAPGSCNVAGTNIQLSDKLKILGATLDSNLTMETHIQALSSSCFYHIRLFKQIRSSLDYDMAISVASALVSSRLDQVNSILYGAASKHTNRLQRVQKALARTVMHQRSHCSPLSSTALLQNLHWLPIEWRIRFKLATLAYKALHTGQPPYLAELLRCNKPVLRTDSAIFVFSSVLCSTVQS